VAMDLIVLGASHHTAPAQIRDEIQFSVSDVESFCGRLRASRDEILELSVLSTCNRTEIYSLVRNPDVGQQLIRNAVEAQKGVPHLANGRYTFLLEGPATVRHLFRVASGIESLMVGEPQILGQVRDAHKMADLHRTSGAVTTRLFDTALRVGKRARTETEIGKGTTSVAYAAVEMALKVFDGLAKHTVAVIGAGETGALVARHLADQKPGRLIIVNRTPERAAQLAAELGAEARPMDTLADVLREASVVVAATGAQEPVIRVEQIREAAKKRGASPLVVVDIANPRNVDPAVSKLDNVFLYDLDALEGIADQNRQRRAKEIPKVEAIVDEEVAQFVGWYESLQVVPVLRALRDRFHTLGEQECEKFARKLTEADRETFRAFSRALVNKLLHHPTSRIRNIDPGTHHGVHRLVAIQELFELELERYAREGMGMEFEDVLKDDSGRGVES
jgi:glutamyl-tRNA reductase